MSRTVDLGKVSGMSRGARGWYIRSWEQVDPDIEARFYLGLLNSDGSIPNSNLFAVNDILSIKAGFSANYALKVFGIIDYSGTECILDVGYTPEFQALNPPIGTGADDGSFSPEYHLYNSAKPGYVWNPEKPDIGTVSIGYGAMAIGSNNLANEWGALAIGGSNIVDGRYAFANGQENVVAYGSAAIGHENKVYAYDAFAAGRNNILRNWSSNAFGRNNEMNAPDGFVSGRGNFASANAHAGVNIRGTYAKAQVSDTYVDVVGIGTSPTNRVNGSALSKDGNYRIRGEILARCNPDSSGGINLLTAINAKEDKNTLTLIDDITITSDVYEDIPHDLPEGKRCVIIYFSIPRTATENYRIYADEKYRPAPHSTELKSENAGYISVTAGGSGVCNAMIKFDCTRGILESEYARQEGSGGFNTIGTYIGFENTPVIKSKVARIIISNFTNGVIRAGTKYRIYGY